MAYDTLGATQLAGQAYQRAVNLANAQRSQLRTQFGVNDDGTMDNTEAGHLGSIYQDNLAGVNNEMAATTQDARKGFGTGGGLGGKAAARAHAGALNQQAVGLRSAFGALSGNQSQKDAAGQDYINEVGDGSGTKETGGNIGRNAAWDLAHTITENPILGAPTPAGAGGSFQAGMTPQQKAMAATGTSSIQAALKRNPRIMQNIRNR